MLSQYGSPSGVNTSTDPRRPLPDPLRPTRPRHPGASRDAARRSSDDASGTLRGEHPLWNGSQKNLKNHQNFQTKLRNKIYHMVCFISRNF